MIPKETAAEDSVMEKETSVPVCKHCGEPMKKWKTPMMGSWDTDWFWVCFNDDCDYFERGWDWMMSQFYVTSSYRYRIDPATGEEGPLPVWSTDALKNGIIEE